ncbi:hypothetical protein [Oharaeibacter diazotrophicus]|uniref:Uncharacterized protein n=1 Tax=Oharaeibacter diazotrophicus TaxID=1920512 RepID=A0A4R6RGR5_9HYPH|nr:hypothetical protein [Oharaeibacter diazotrophicus]TDP85589.1 hypothetical protein EDD54_2444 [Oharaeibacter diazotrophicus]BBE74560.1 hypothetical protein OHA_1_04192 [Pleomorphomonas sp. SM30]GLS75741.1 hypothetical protein GCM10007904_10760 [Oharaeibacter diazotrophicus]
MKLSHYTPNLTVAEADRFWMTPAEVCELAAIGESEAADVRKFLSNLSDRGYIPCVKSGTAKTSPKLYSLVSAICLRAFKEITRSGRTYDFAAPIVAHVADLSRELIVTHDNINDLDTGPDWLVVYEANHRGEPKVKSTVRGDNIKSEHFYSGGGYDFGVFSSGEVIWNVVRHYADYWANDRILKGLDQVGRYEGCDDNGRPLDPSHPWNANLPPLQRAKRMVEIEEYIIERDRRHLASVLESQGKKVGDDE